MKKASSDVIPIPDEERSPEGRARQLTSSAQLKLRLIQNQKQQPNRCLQFVGVGLKNGAVYQDPVVAL